MQNIINDYAKLIGTGDLFHLWQDEYKLRTTLRNVSAAGGSVEIKSREEYYFFKRSLYYNNPANFFIILFKNMHHMPVLNCVLESGPAFKTDFFYYLLTYILEQRPPAPDLLFLINIYQDNLHSFFEEVVDVMDDELCSYLLPRTIKKPLRKLLKARKNRLSEQARGKSEALLQPVYANNEYPTIFGDKIQIITCAINLLKSDHSDSLDSLLDGAEMLFKAGLLTDCLAVLVELAKCQANKDPLFLFREEAYCQKMQQILRKALPFYSLLVCPGDSYRYALRLYRGLFPGFKPDTASLIYLDIHVIAAANLQGYQQYASYEISQKAHKILSYRPDDPVATSLKSPRKRVAGEEITELILAIKQRILALPHESLAIMELLRTWQQEDRLLGDVESPRLIFQHYLDLFHWIPGTALINEQLLKQLGPWIGENLRSEGQQIVAAMQEYPNKLAHNNLKANISGSGSTYLHKQLLLGQFMGVS